MTFIIAEVGSNFENFEDAKTSISLAKNCGADAVKFQMFSQKDLYGFNVDPESHNPIGAWIPKLKEKADSIGIEFMCTAFSPEGVKLVDPFVKRHKIASSDLSYPALLKEVAKTGKPAILSVGASSITDINLALAHLQGAPKVTLLYCVANYPSKNVNLFHLDALNDAFPPFGVGYSCHTTDWYTPVAAVKYHQAQVIEKHFKLRDMKTPDSPHSLNPDEFKLMVDAIRSGKPKINFPDPQEIEFQLKHNRRLIAIQNVSAGQALQYDVNYGCYRSLKEDREGLSGFAAEKVNGLLAKRDIKAGEPIGPDCIEV